MRIILRYLFVLISSFFLALSVCAQVPDSTVHNNKIQFKLSVNYNSNLNYYGRVDSLKSSGFFPLAEVWFTPDLYINAAPVFVHNTVSSFEYAGTLATLGYQFHSKDKLSGNIYFLKPFYKSKSQLVQSALKAQTGVNLTLLNKILNVTAGADAKFSDNIDFGSTGGLDHIFRFNLPGETVLVFDPSAFIYAGTQQFTETYYKKTSFLFLPGNEQAVTTNVKKFNVLSYEFSVPVVLRKGKFQVLFTPAYVIPQNLIVISGRPDLSEKGNELFYATVGVKLSF